jgi:hypothetical protein
MNLTGNLAFQPGRLPLVPLVLLSEPLLSLGSQPTNFFFQGLADII